MVTMPHCFSKIFYLFLSIFPCIIVPISILNWFLLTFSLLVVIFLSFQGLRKLRKVAKLKHYAAHLEWEGLQELAMVDTPMSQLVDLVSAGVCKSQWVSYPFPQCTSFRPCPKESPSCSHYHIHCPEGEDDIVGRYPYPWAPLRPLLAPWKALSFQQWWCRGTSCPLPHPQLALPARSFMQVNL